MKLLLTIPVLGLLPLAVASPAPAPTPDGGVPDTIHYQSRILDKDGLPLSQTGLSVAFAIYDAPLGGAMLWNDSGLQDIANGLLDVELGPIPKSVFDCPDLYLGITIGADPEMVPRHRLVSVPFAQRACVADDVPGKDIDPNSVSVNGLLVIDDSGNWVGPAGPGGVWMVDEGSIQADGLVGINADPLAVLHINAPVNEDALRIQVQGQTRMFLHENGNLSLGGMGSLLTPDSLLHVSAFNGEDAFRVNVDGSTRMFVDQDGNVEIGGELHVTEEGRVGVGGPPSGISRMDITSSERGLNVYSSGVGPNDSAISAQSGGTAAVLGLQAYGTNRLVEGVGGGEVRFAVESSGRVVATSLEITGGADLVEGFETSGGTLEPGTVAVIDSDSPGRLEASAIPYDKRVAGVVSGAGGINPGLELGQQGVIEGEVKVAMVGRVYVRCTDESGPIRPGDRLTTSSLAGHAMAAIDESRCDGAVLGKAMTSLDEGQGLVLVLVNLQ